MTVKAALIHQWKEFCVCQLDRCATEKDLADRLKELDTYLADRVYFVDQELTSADITIYKSLHTVFTTFAFNDKEAYRNISRWFDNVQKQCSTEVGLKQLIFLKSPIYLKPLV